MTIASSKINNMTDNSYIINGVLHVRAYFKVSSATSDTEVLFRLNNCVGVNNRVEGFVLNKKTVIAECLSYGSDIRTNSVISASTTGGDDLWRFIVIDIPLQ